MSKRHNKIFPTDPKRMKLNYFERQAKIDVPYFRILLDRRFKVNRAEWILGKGVNWRVTGVNFDLIGIASRVSDRKAVIDRSLGSGHLEGVTWRDVTALAETPLALPCHVDLWVFAHKVLCLRYYRIFSIKNYSIIFVSIFMS